MMFIENHPYWSIVLTAIFILLAILIAVIVTKKLNVSVKMPTAPNANWYSNKKNWHTVMYVILAIFLLGFAFDRMFWQIIWANGLLFFVAIILALVLLFTVRKGKSWIVAGIAVLLFTSGRGWKSKPEKVDKETQNVLAAQEAGKRSGVIEIDTIIEFNGTNEFVFELGDHMFYDIRAITTGEGFWWRKDAVIYFQIPSGAIFRVDEEGHAFPIHDSTASPKSISSGKIRVWGTGTAKIKTFWKDPKYVTASK